MIGETVLVKYKADTADMVGGLNAIIQKERQLADVAARAASERNAGIESQIGKWTAMAGRIAGATAAVAALKSGWNEYLNDQRLATATAGLNIDRLRAASAGLVGETELLTFAAKTSHGAFKLTEEQMSTVLTATRQLAREGHDYQTVLESLTKVMVDPGGAVGALEKFGIQAKEGKTESEKFSSALEALAGKAGELKGANATQAESMQQLGVSVSDSFSKIKSSLGEMVVAFKPVLDLLADILSGLADVAGSLTSSVDLDFLSEEGGKKMVERLRMQAAGWNTVSASAPNLIDEDAPTAAFVEWKAEQDKIKRTSNAYFDQINSNLLDLAEASKETARRRQASRSGRGAGRGRVSAGPITVDEGMEGAVSDLSLGQAAESFGYDSLAFGEELAGGLVETNPLERMFGSIEDFNAYGQAFSMLQGAATSALDAWITGSESAGAAVKKFFGESLRGMAADMLGQSLRHAAYALGALAVGDFKGAALHGKSAAGFAAGAVVAGGLAKQLGAGAVSGGGGSGGPSNQLGSGGAGGSEAQRPIVIVYGDDFANSSPHMRARESKRMVAAGLEQLGHGAEGR